MSLVVYGANGSTGSRVVELAVAAGVAPIVAGRREEALRAVADPHGLEVRTGDLDRVFAGATVVVSSAGPYSRIGAPIAEAAVRAGAHHIDFSGEPRWVQWLIEHLDGAGPVLVPAVGLGVAGDLAAQSAAGAVGAVEELAIGYHIIGMRPSTATLRSTVELIAGGAPVSESAKGPGHLANTRFAASGSEVHELGRLFPSPDALLLARVHPGARVATYMRYPGPAAPAFAGVGRLLRRPRALAAARAVTDALPTFHGGGGRAVATAIASGGGERALAEAHVDDVYEVSARGAWYAAQRLLAGTSLTGVRAWGEVAGDPAAAARAVGVRIG